METCRNMSATIICAKTNFFKHTAHQSDKEMWPGEVINGWLSLTHTRAQRVEREKKRKTSWYVVLGAKKNLSQREPER